MFSSELLIEGSIYTRKDLSEKFSITDATIHTGVFPLDSYRSIWLFITEKKTEGATQYADLLENDTLLWDGQMEGHKDKSIINHEVNAIPLLFRRKTGQESGTLMQTIHCYNNSKLSSTGDNYGRFPSTRTTNTLTIRDLSA